MPGTATSRTRAEYDERHVERVRLVRALVEHGQVPIASVRTIVEALDSPPPGRHELLGVAHCALPTPPGSGEVAPDVAGLVADLGWYVAPDAPGLVALSDAVAAARQAGIALDGATMRRYAQAMREVAAVDVDLALGAGSTAEALRLVVVGTVLVDPVLRRPAPGRPGGRERRPLGRCRGRPARLRATDTPPTSRIHHGADGGICHRVRTGSRRTGGRQRTRPDRRRRPGDGGRAARGARGCAVLGARRPRLAGRHRRRRGRPAGPRRPRHRAARPSTPSTASSSCTVPSSTATCPSCSSPPRTTPRPGCGGWRSATTSSSPRSTPARCTPASSAR